MPQLVQGQLLKVNDISVTSYLSYKFNSSQILAVFAGETDRGSVLQVRLILFIAYTSPSTLPYNLRL